jgi:hypothetical protein
METDFFSFSFRYRDVVFFGLCCADKIIIISQTFKKLKFAYIPVDGQTAGESSVEL